MSKKQFHEELADKVVKMLEDGTAPWIKPWEAGEIELPFNPLSGTRYRGANILALYGEPDPRWMTYKQAKSEGWQVKKGEKSTRIQYWKLFDEKFKKDANGKKVYENGKPVVIRVRREYPTVFHASVFNANQIEGIPEYKPGEKPNFEWENEKVAEQLILESGASIIHKSGDRAFYSPTFDRITLPEKKQFDAPDKYYATLFHELGHWTGHRTRFDRDMSGKHGSESYAKEELRAELSSFITCAELGLGHDPSQHVSYIGSWIKIIKDDAKELVKAAASAEKISKVILSPDLSKSMFKSKSDIEEKTLKAVSLENRKFSFPLNKLKSDIFLIEKEPGQFANDAEGNLLTFISAERASDKISEVLASGSILNFVQYREVTKMNVNEILSEMDENLSLKHDVFEETKSILKAEHENPILELSTFIKQRYGEKGLGFTHSDFGKVAEKVCSDVIENSWFAMRGEIAEGIVAANNHNHFLDLSFHAVAIEEKFLQYSLENKKLPSVEYLHKTLLDVEMSKEYRGLSEAFAENKTKAYKVMDGKTVLGAYSSKRFADKVISMHEKDDKAKNVYRPNAYTIKRKASRLAGKQKSEARSR